jgi:hypothetical protein
LQDLDAHAAKIIRASRSEKQGWDAIIKIIIGEMWWWWGRGKNFSAWHGWNARSIYGFHVHIFGI